MYVHEITSSNTSNRSPPPRILGPCLGAAPRRFVRVRKFGNYARERVEGWRPSSVYYTLRGRWWWNKLPRHVERWKGICQMILPIFADLPSDTFNFLLPRDSHSRIRLIMILLARWEAMIEERQKLKLKLTSLDIFALPRRTHFSAASLHSRGVEKGEGEEKPAL